MLTEDQQKTANFLGVDLKYLERREKGLTIKVSFSDILLLVFC